MEKQDPKQTDPKDEASKSNVCAFDTPKVQPLVEVNPTQAVPVEVANPGNLVNLSRYGRAQSLAPVCQNEPCRQAEKTVVFMTSRIPRATRSRTASKLNP